MMEQGKFVIIFSASLLLTVMSLYSQGYVEDAFLLLVISATAVGILTSILVLVRKRFGRSGDD